MKLLLDTHILLWSAGDPERIPESTRNLLLDSQTELYFSAASLWEIAIKRGMNRSDFSVDPHVLRRELLDNEYEELPITGEHAIFTESLPQIHKDPFDRILVAQATIEGITLVTADTIVQKYPGPIMPVTLSK